MSRITTDALGGVGMTTTECDNKKCRKSCVLVWRGRSGEYCSNTCLRAVEENPMSNEETEVMEENEVEETAPAAKTKKKKGGKAAKKAKTAKASKTAKSAKANGAVKKVAKTNGRDPRLPKAGSVIEKDYNGKKLKVTVLDDGFKFGKETYKSLSAIGKELTGGSCNGYVFFGLNG